MLQPLVNTNNIRIIITEALVNNTSNLTPMEISSIVETAISEAVYISNNKKRLIQE